MTPSMCSDWYALTKSVIAWNKLACSRRSRVMNSVIGAGYTVCSHHQRHGRQRRGRQRAPATHDSDIGLGRVSAWGTSRTAPWATVLASHRHSTSRKYPAGGHAGSVSAGTRAAPSCTRPQARPCGSSKSRAHPAWDTKSSRVTFFGAIANTAHGQYHPPCSCTQACVSGTWPASSGQTGCRGWSRHTWCAGL